MGKMVVMSLMVLIVMSAFVSTSNAKAIGYPAMQKGGIPKQSGPPGSANRYTRGCNTKEGCRPGETENR
ncbi:hypothetical protein C2S51_015977 [Perilla frutescens var. frutescens]|nr:hypothetical protein C2S51_015977 [Perilla frutescens var. frutescens]